MKILSYLCAFVCGIIAVIFCGAAFHHQPDRHSERAAKVQLTGKEAADYLLQGDGQSLMQALTAARFGLQWQEHAPGDGKTAGGYLGMSHEQNLNAWFDEDGVTVRPTLLETKRDQAWSMALRLQAYGYGKQLSPVPPIVSRQVKENRIEYQREDQGHASAHLGSRISHPALTEWYENRAEGIEQGFTINERPERGDVVAFSEPLRVLQAVTGDLSARTTEGGGIELADRKGTGVLSYSKLVAQDADGKQLAARMEASADGRELALVVVDAGARYPIVIDPIVASLEQKLRAGIPQTDARFGTAVAIDGDRAVVGAWREDVPNTALVDAGAVYIFSRSGTVWSGSLLYTGDVAGGGCGSSVAINGTRVAFGCPGTTTTNGRAFIHDLAIATRTELLPPLGGQAGDSHGASVAVSGNYVVVGEPLRDTSNGTDSGRIARFILDSNLVVTSSNGIVDGAGNVSEHFGTSVAISNGILVVGTPNAFSNAYLAGRGKALVINLADLSDTNYLIASNGVPGDNFGQSVAISGNTAVIGAWGNDDKGTNAGAAYVFVHDMGAQWHEEQKLTASDGKANDYFSVSAVAIQGNTIVVGAYGWDATGDPNGDNDERGAAYIFTRNGAVWTQQARILANDSQTGDNFGIGVGIDGNSVISGARHATAVGTAAAGAAYVYRLDCVPPYGTQATFIFEPPPYFDTTNYTVCQGTRVTFSQTHKGNATSYQWRRNGVNLPGATNSSYTVNSVGVSDAGTYDVVAANACGSDISSPAILGVHTFTLTPMSRNFGSGASNGSVNVAATGSCAWAAVSNSPFVTITSGVSGTGNGTVLFNVAANPNPGQRTGTITIAGLTFSISQDGISCSYGIAPTSQSFSAGGGGNSVNVMATAGCGWSATNNNPEFITINSGANGTGNGAVSYSVAPSTGTARTGTLTIAGQIFTVMQAAPQPATLGNISTRLRVETGDNVLIGGFIVTGTQNKKIIVRAIGPSLPFADTLADPILELHDSSGALLEANDNWMDSPNKQAIIDSTIAPSNPLESAIIRSVPPANYTAIVRGVNDGTGIGVVEGYDLDTAADSKLANISTRGLVQSGDNVLIAGTIVVGQSSQKVIIRALGPSVSVPGKMADPTLELHDGNGALLESNDNWIDSPNKQAIIDSTIPPTNELESAIVRTLSPANYTAIVRGANNTTGIAVVEVYALQ